MKKRIWAFIITVCLLLTGFCNWSEMEYVEAADEVEVTIHYHRYDGNYDKWSMWLWADGRDGRAYEFTGMDEYGAYLTTVMPDMDGVNSIGFIVRKGEWEMKDVEQDRFIDISDGTGKVEIYLLEGDAKYYPDASTVDLSPVIKSAYFPTSKKIDVNVTMPVDTSDERDTSLYRVYDGEGNSYEINKIWTDNPGLNTSFSVIMEEYLDMGKTYILEIEGYGSMTVAVEDAFSEPEFEAAYTYNGDDLGAVYTKEQTDFRVWAPTADAVNVKLYEKGDGDNFIQSVAMDRDVNGTWKTSVKEDLGGKYYTYELHFGDVVTEAVDVYAKAAGVNGLRGMILDLDATDPEGWDKDKGPKIESNTDAVIYELHVRDMGSDSSSGITNAGKYLSFTESGTTNSTGLSTGLDHMVDLGITHVHLLPVYDYASVDEASGAAQFNWGYDPLNYNVPEGSYSTDPYNGEVRVNEFKQMVQSLHEKGIGVIMDVVYNHTYSTDSNLNRTVPDYYYRKDGTTFTNGSGCGNELATERSMVRKYIVDSVVYWAKEYHIDGFRFDLMGCYDIETMNAIRAALDEIDPTIIMYGEGWTGGTSALPSSEAAVKLNTKRLNNIAAFSDDLRDGIKGSVFNAVERGFVSGAWNKEEAIKYGVVAATKNEQVLHGLYWANIPGQCINYASAHDNLSLWDKLASSNASNSIEDRIRMNNLSAAIVLTSQGVPFFQAGEEILRSKVRADGSFDENSYKSSDAVNSIKWDEKTDNIAVYEYYKGLIAFRKEHELLRMRTTEEIQANLSFVQEVPDNVVAYTIVNALNPKDESLYIAYNANKEDVVLTLPEGTWNVYVNDEKAGTKVLESVSGEVTVHPISAVVLVKEALRTDEPMGKGMLIGIGAGIVALTAGVLALFGRKKKKKK